MDGIGVDSATMAHRQLDFSTDSAALSTFETLPLTPPPKPNGRSQIRSPAPGVPPFSDSHPHRTFRSLSASSFASASVLSSPLRPQSGSASESRPAAMPVAPMRSPYAQTSPFSPASARPGPAVASWPSFTREPPVLKNAPHFHGEVVQPSMNRLVSMERGETFEDQGLSLTSGDKQQWQRASRIVRVLVAIRQIFRSGMRPTKKLFLLILLNFTYSAIQFLIGLFTGRIGLVSDSFHLTFGCGVLTLSLYAMTISQNKPDSVFTYGYKRLEVLAAFTNALFLLFLSFSLAVEGLHAFIQDESAHKHYLIVSAVTNLVVNLLGVWFFRHYARLHVVYRKAEDMNLHAVCLHVLADSIRSAGVILASWLLAIGITNAETLCYLLVSASVILMTLPIFKASGGVLLQMAPTGISSSAFHKCLRQVLMFEGVAECYISRFWDMAPGAVVGTLVLRVKKEADEQKILRHVHSVYNDLGVQDLTVQLNRDR